MVLNVKPKQSFFSRRKAVLSLIIILTFFGISLSRMSLQSNAFENNNNLGATIESVPLVQTTILIDIILAGYNDEYIDLTMIDTGLVTSVNYYGIDYVWNEDIQDYESTLDLQINLEYNFHFTTENYVSDLNDFIDVNSFNSTTSALNATQLNAQEVTGERMAIFYEQEGRAIDGVALEDYLVNNKGYTSTEPSYTIYFLNQSRFDTTDHSFEHWFEVDEIDPDSNITADWWRLEWDNDLNPDVEFPYPCWGFQNRIFFADPYCHQWYTKWTDIWWNPDHLEEQGDYLTVDLDTYLEGYTPGNTDYKNRLNTYLIDYLNDVGVDVGGRGDGYLTEEKEVSAQILFMNNQSAHGYSQEDLQWIYHQEELEDAFEYVVPSEVANITLEDTWVDLSVNAELNNIIADNTFGVAELGSYPWYDEDWTYLDGISIFYALEAVRENYFDMSKGDAIFTSWIILLQNISMVGYSYGEYREYTGLGGGGNVVCYKDLNRYFASDGTTPRSGLSTLLIHEIGHVLGFMHAENTNDADEGTGGFISDVMSYYTQGAPDFSVFLRDSLYRTSSFVVYYQNKPAIDLYRANPLHNTTSLAEVDQVVADAEADLALMNYIDAFLQYRQLYEMVNNLEEVTPTTEQGIELSVLLIILPASIFATVLISRKRRS